MSHTLILGTVWRKNVQIVANLQSDLWNESMIVLLLLIFFSGSNENQSTRCLDFFPQGYLSCLFKNVHTTVVHTFFYIIIDMNEGSEFMTSLVKSVLLIIKILYYVLSMLL